MDTCDGCGGNKFIEYEADLTCRSCGLVKQERLVQDHIDYVPFSDQSCYHYDEDNKSISEKFSKKLLDIKRDLESMRLFDIEILPDSTKKLVLHVIKDTFEHDHTLAKGERKKQLVCLAIYYVGMYMNTGISLQQICKPVEISAVKTQALFSEVLPIWSKKKWFRKLKSRLFVHVDKIKRVVYEMNFINNKMQVINVAQKIYEKVQYHFSVNKSHTLIYCCVFIGCKVNKVKIQKKKYCQLVNVSLPTLNHHEEMVQSILKEL